MPWVTLLPVVFNRRPAEVGESERSIDLRVGAAAYGEFLQIEPVKTSEVNLSLLVLLVPLVDQETELRSAVLKGRDCGG